MLLLLCVVIHHIGISPSVEANPLFVQDGYIYIYSQEKKIAGILFIPLPIARSASASYICLRRRSLVTKSRVVKGSFMLNFTLCYTCTNRYVFPFSDFGFQLCVLPICLFGAFTFRLVFRLLFELEEIFDAINPSFKAVLLVLPLQSAFLLVRVFFFLGTTAFWLLRIALARRRQSIWRSRL